jgi:hypothetical protein
VHPHGINHKYHRLAVPLADLVRRHPVRQQMNVMPGYFMNTVAKDVFNIPPCGP